ncbi:MAG: ABC transporter substrate-binding protein [Clostridiaceae bacterium]|nr:ABC transporter substrate-binding protein [Clostridiaceae bacterium]
MNNKLRKILIITSLVLILGLVFTACTKPGDGDDKNKTTPLVVGYSPFSGKFSPFFATTGYDMDAAEITQVQLMETDRVGGIIFNGLDGETREYNGTEYTYKGISDIKVEIDETNNTTKYTIKIRQGVKFSDGHELDADDVIFCYYVLSDPSYTGSSTLYAVPIIGMKNYRANNSLMESVDVEAGKALIPEDEELQQAVIDKVIKPILTDELEWVRSIPDDETLMGYYGKYVEEYPETKDLFAFFYALDPEYDSTDKEEAQVLQDIIAQYGYDYEALGSSYAGDTSYFIGDVEEAITPILVERLGEEPEEVPNITGIKKIDKYTVEVTTYGYDAPAIYQICGISVAPMHYYGDESQYDYENNKFGFPRGNLEIVESKTSKPMGAGPYVFEKYENKIVYYTANKNYWKGEPKIKNLQFKETDEKDKVTGITTGTIDITDPSGSKDRLNEIKGYNSNNELSGNVITTSLVDNLGYGYIGINAFNVKVGDDPASEASKNLRKGLATVLAVYRELTVDSYYGDAASVINYPISNTSWAAPQKSDSDYEVAYSKDVDGKPIYSSSMSAEDKYQAALDACVGFLKAAGFTYDESAKKFTAAPEGARLEYELIIPAEGSDEHPSYLLVNEFAKAVEKIGIKITINNPSDSNVLWNKLDAMEQDIWVAAWGATIDPDMYQVYHSSNIVGKGGTNNNHYAIESEELDKLIMDARKSADQAYRKLIYKQALDLILDWGVEIPVYQRQNCIIFSSERVDISTVTPDITTFYGWMREIEKISLK